MINSLPLRASYAVFLPMLLAGLLSSCASGLKKNDAIFDTSAVKLIQLDIDTLNQQALGISIAKQEMMGRVRKNLADWGYPIEIMGGLAYTHILKVHVNPVEHGATPTGFSFSSGNSDPRAIDYQKTDVLPVSCVLTSIAHPEQTTLLSMDFTAGNSIKGPDRQVRFALTSDKLVDHISTVCFNLLSDLKWPDRTQNLSVPVVKQGWIPEIRIETVENPAEEVKNNKPGSNASRNSEGRKQIIIHNQGSPVILKFGHERK